MKHEKLLSRAFNIIVVLTIAAILSAGIFFVYRTFERSVEADIFMFSRELEEAVRHIAGAEYRRYLILVDAGRTIGGSGSDEQLRDGIESRASMYGQDGDIPDFIDAIGYFHNREPETAFEYVIAGSAWEEKTNIFNKKPIKQGWGLFFTGSDSSPENLYIAVENESDDRVVFFRLDRDGFIDTYIKDIIEATNRKFRFEWYSEKDSMFERNGIPEKDFPPQPDGNKVRYSFRPLRILTGTNREAVPLTIGMPGMMEVRRMLSRDSINENDFEKEQPERPIFFRTGVYVKIYHQKGSFYHDFEYEAAVNFIEVILVFIIIGGLFILLLFQLQRTRLLRRKEKEFVASVTHELRTPLTVIRSAADNLGTGIVPVEKLRIYSGLITEQSERLGNMIEEILLYSKFEERAGSPDSPVPLSFVDLLPQIMDPLDSLSESRGISLSWDISGLPETAASYPGVVRLVVNNLVTNALNHAYQDYKRGPRPEKEPEIRIRFRLLIPDRLEIVVEDDGRGIDPRETRRIFDPFYRDNVSRSRQEKGSGLGLFIARRKAVVSGGKLTVESPYRRIDGSRPPGARFVLILPCVKEPSDV